MSNNIDNDPNWIRRKEIHHVQNIQYRQYDLDVAMNPLWGKLIDIKNMDLTEEEITKLEEGMKPILSKIESMRNCIRQSKTRMKRKLNYAKRKKELQNVR